MQRTSDYYFDTVDLADPNATVYLSLIRQTVRKSNRRGPGRFGVRVRGRLGKNNPNAPLYSVGGPKWRQCGQEIDFADATRVDVYIYPR